MNICCLLHAPFEGLGQIEDWIHRRGHQHAVVRLYQDDPLPSVETADWLIVMGGPMNVYEYRNYPWLRAEKRFLKRAIEQGKTVLGICLGAQLLADVLGAKVYQNEEKEIGWLPITLLPGPETDRLFPGKEDEFTVFHWHGDTFDLPPGAVCLAESAGCRHQAFVCQERLVGLQFHLEMTSAGLRELVDNCRDDITSGLFVQVPERVLLAEQHQPVTQRILWNLLDALAAGTRQPLPAVTQ